jgi:hypothetical protein
MDLRDRRIQEARLASSRPWGYSSDSSSEITSEGSSDDLTETHQPGRKKECVDTNPVTVASVFDAYWTSLTPEEKGDTEAWREEYLAERRLELLAERREAVIRSRIDASWGHPPQHFGLKHTMPLRPVELLDVPPFDPNPNFSRFERSVDEVNLRVIRGNWLTPATKSWFWEHATLFSWDRPRPPPPQVGWANGGSSSSSDSHSTEGLE